MSVSVTLDEEVRQGFCHGVAFEEGMMILADF